MNVHALSMRDRFGDALEKVIMNLYSHGVQIIAGTGLAEPAGHGSP